MMYELIIMRAIAALLVAVSVVLVIALLMAAKGTRGPKVM